MLPRFKADIWVYCYSRGCVADLESVHPTPNAAETGRANGQRGWAGRERLLGLCRGVAQYDEGGIHCHRSRGDHLASQVRSSPAETIFEKVPRHRLQVLPEAPKSTSRIGNCLGHPLSSNRMEGDRDQAPFLTSNVQGVTLNRVTRPNRDATCLGAHRRCRPPHAVILDLYPCLIRSGGDVSRLAFSSRTVGHGTVMAGASLLQIECEMAPRRTRRSSAM